VFYEKVVPTASVVLCKVAQNQLSGAHQSGLEDINRKILQFARIFENPEASS